MRPPCSWPALLASLAAMTLLTGPVLGQDTEDEGQVRERRRAEQADRFSARFGSRDLRDVQRRAAETGEREADAARRETLQRERTLGAALAAPTWTNLGPTFNPTFASPIGTAKSGQDDTGLITAIAPHPTDAGTLIIGAAGGGLYRTTDGGATWKALADNLPAGGLSIGAVAYAPSDPTRVYAGSSCGDSSTTKIGRPADALVKTGLGFLVSRDGGDTWNRVPNVPADFFWAISVDPASADTLLIAGDRGVYRSTDGGATWAGVLVLTSGNRLFATSLSRCASAPGTLYAGVFSPGGLAGQVWRSTDGGLNWTDKSNGWPGNPELRGRVQVAVAPTNPSRVYALIADQNDKQVDMIGSSDGGDTWVAFGLGSRTPAVNILGTQGGFANVIAVDPKSQDTVWAGGLDLWRSADAGGTFTKVSDWSPPTPSSQVPYLHADQHALVWGPDGSLYAGNDGGIYRRAEDGTWRSLNKGIVAWLVDELCISPDGAVIMNGAQDNGTSVRVSGTDWTQIGGGDGMGCLVHPTNKQVLTISVNQQGISVSTDGGKTFNDAQGLTDAGSGPNSAWRTLLVQDPTNASRVFTYSKKMVWVSTDSGATWSKAASRMPLLEAIVDLSISPDGSRMLLADRKTVFESADLGQTWTRRGEVPVEGISAVRPDRSNAQTIYVSVDTLTAQKERVWVTTNGGESWTPLSKTAQDGGLPDLPVLTLEQDPKDANGLWAGAFTGLYRSGDKGQTWTRHGTGLPNVPVGSIRFPADGDTAIVGTVGRGVWQVSTAASVTAGTPGPAAATAPVADFTFTPASPRPGQAVSFKDASAYMTSWSWDFGDGKTDTHVNPSHVFAQAGTYQVKLTVSNGSQTSTKEKQVTVSLPGTGTGSVLTYLLPVVVRSAGQGGTSFGTELTLTNRSATDLALTFRATTVPGTATYALGPGQVVFPDVFAFLTAQGLAVPAGNVVTPLRIEVSGASGLGSFGAQVRVTTPPNDALRGQGVAGKFGLAFPATPLTTAASGLAVLYGLQQTSDAGQPGSRSNLACVNAGTGSNGTITLEVTYRDGDTGLAHASKDTFTLGAFQWDQKGTPLSGRGIQRGYAQVKRTSGDDQFVCYATVLDNVTGDSAFVPMAVTDTPSEAHEAMMPVVLDAGGYKSELTISNRGIEKVSGEFALIPSGSNVPQYGDLEVEPLQQVTFADFIAELRAAGFDVPAGTVASVYFSFSTSPTTGGGRGVEANPTPVSTSDVSVSVRTYASRAGGTFGLAYPATAVGAAADTEAWVFGLQQTGTRGEDGGTRSNLGLVHALGGDEEDLGLEVTYFGPTGAELGREQVTLVAGQWSQIGTPLSRFPGATTGYARIRRLSGSDQFIAYGVLNDQANDDGSFIPMIVP